MTLSNLRDRLKVQLFLGLLLITLLCLLSALAYSYHYLNSPLKNIEGDQQLVIASGNSLNTVLNDLVNSDYIDKPVLVKLLAKWRGVENKIQAGEYRLSADLTPAQFLTRVVSGDSIQYRLTLVEGWTLQQALDEIWRSEKIIRELAGSTAEELLAMFAVDVPGPEGQLFPDTYFYSAGTSDREILLRAHARLNTVLDKAWEERLGALPLNSAYEALILASIIEKESAVGAERGHISGVFIRRLEQGMRLQSDPTVIYGMNSDYEGNIRQADLQQTTAYNTYRINGLPPTPIALAGEQSIVAALNPLPSDYLYFVAKGDGSHQFSNNLEEHNAAVNLYQRQN